MTPEEFAAKMQEIAEAGDPEAAHTEADALMCKVLAALGYEAGVRTFRHMRKWYA